MIITRLLLEKTIYKFFTDRWNYFICILLIPITFVLDIIFLPQELIALSLYKKYEKYDEEGEE